MFEPTLAKKWDGSKDVTKYIPSEKLDGERAIWYGNKLWTRNQKETHAPKWFLDNIPSDITLDGELYAGRGKFEKVSSTVRKHNPIDSEWKDIKYVIFDAPSVQGRYLERMEAVADLLKEENVDRRFVKGILLYNPFKSNDELYYELDRIVDEGGEGLMLRDAEALFYESGRSNTLLKVKKQDDAEAIVLGYKDGKGKYSGMVGSLKCKMVGKDINFNCSGMTDTERDNPPPVGSIITYAYNGLTKNGKPRFPRFIRVKND